MSFYDRIRHRSADSVARGPATGSVDALVGRSYCLLVSFRRDGTPVPTPVWYGVLDSRVYVRTEADSWKVKRIRRDQRVRVAPCTARGRPLGPPFEGIARVLDPPDKERAERIVAANYGLERRLYNRLLGEAPEHAAFIEIECMDRSAS